MTTLQFSVIERENIEVGDFFDGLSDTDRKSIKELSCKLVKQINERKQAELKMNLIKHEKDMLEQ